MIAGTNQPDELDRLLFAHLDDWVALKWRDGPVRPPKGVPYGTHLATLLHCRHGGEIRGLNLCWLVESSAGQFYRVGEFQQGMDTTWLFRYSTIRQYEITPLERAQAHALGLPILSLTDELPPGIGEFRQRRDLDRHRHPGYPDSVASGYGTDIVLKGDVTLHSEQLWVRVNRVVSHIEFESELLNTPAFFGGAAGQRVTTRILDFGGTDMVFSFPANTSEEASGSVLPNERCN